jgi:transketolase
MFNPDLHLNPNWSKETSLATRDGFGASLVDLANQKSEIIVLTADLADSLRLESYKTAHKDRFLEIGIAEQNMVGIAAGLAAEGFIPVITSYGVFSPGRNWDQIRVQLGYSQLNVKIVSSHVGLITGPDGAVHQGLEDIALARAIPNLSVLCPVDYHQAIKATRDLIYHPGPAYLRLSRPNSPQITAAQTPFSLGQAQIIRFGTTVTLVATGSMVAEALKAAAEIDAEVINIHTIKPLDIKTIFQSLQKTGKLIVIEEHQQAGGLGSAIFEAFVHAGMPLPPTKHLAVTDQFGQSGTSEELLEAYGLTWHHLIEKFSQFD